MKAFLIDTAERTVSTYLQVLIGLLLTLGTIDVHGLAVAAVAAIPAALTVLRAVAARILRLPVPRTLGVDLLVRVVATYVEAVLGFAIATVALPDGTFDVGALGAAALAAVPAVLSLVKGWLASNVGSPVTGGLTPRPAVDGVHDITSAPAARSDTGAATVDALLLLLVAVLVLLAVILAAALAGIH